MATESTNPANTIAEIHSTPAEEITEEQTYRWYDELLIRKTNANTDEELEYFEQLSDALVQKLCDSIDRLPANEQDAVRKIFPDEKWAADVADGIETARKAGDLRKARMGEEILKETFALNIITRH